MKVIITGGAGFIGSHTADYFLAQGAEVAIIDSCPHGVPDFVPAGAAFYRADIRDAAAVRGIFERERPDTLVHLAAQISTYQSVLDPVNDAEINLIGTLNLLEAGRQNGLKRVVYASSAAVYGEPEYLPIDEAHPLTMLSGYGVSKRASELYLGFYQRLHGISYCALRYANVYGPRQGDGGEGGVVSIFVRKYMEGEAPAIFGNGEAARDFVYVKDVARANYLAACSDKCGIFNVCSNTLTTINQLVETLNEVFRRQVVPVLLPPREGDILLSRMSHDLLTKQFDWRPEYSLAAGLAETVPGNS